MTSNQITMLLIMVVYLVANAVLGVLYSKRQERLSEMSFDKKYSVYGLSV